VVASVLVTTRFIFALARDRGLPFSTLLKQTAKDGEPWMADLALFVALYLSSTGYLNNTTRYCNLIQTFGLWFVSVAYVSHRRYSRC
jgi:amino acid transporter